MLRKVGESAWPISEKDAVVSIKDASYPIPFPQGLEFNSPAHGCWNIVHTGMLIPEAHQIYVCADNCMRGVVLTAAEMCEEDRFSFVIVEEQNLLSGNLEDVTIEGTADILRKLKEREEKTGQKMPEGSSSVYSMPSSFSRMRFGADLQGTGATISRNQIFEMLYGSNYAKTWTNTGSKASKSNV